MSQSPGGEPGSIELANEPARNQLKADAVTLPGVLMQSVTSIAPAIAGMFTVPFIVLNAGVSAPLAYRVGQGVVLVKKAAMSRATSSGSSQGAKWPPRGITVHRRI